MRLARELSGCLIRGVSNGIHWTALFSDIKCQRKVREILM